MTQARRAPLSIFSTGRVREISSRPRSERGTDGSNPCFLQRRVNSELGFELTHLAVVLWSAVDT
jgi:hypothetical protein